MCVTLSRQNMQNFLFCFFCQASSASFFRPRRSLSRPRSRSRGSLIPSFYPPASGDSSESPPAPTLTFSDQSPPAERACFSTFAVAHRRLGPTSSASISTVDLVSPSVVSHERDRSRPTTTTRLPLVRDSATFSARVRQAFARKYDVSPSFHCPEASWYRLLTAIRKFATAAPFGVYRSSGSSTRFPTMTTWFPLAISITTSSLPSRPAMATAGSGGEDLCQLCRPLHDLVADDLIRQGQEPLHLGDDRRLRTELDHGVDALGLLPDLEGETPLPPPVDVGNLAALIGEELGDPIDDTGDRLVVRVRVEDDHDLVLPHSSSCGLRPPVGSRSGPSDGSTSVTALTWRPYQRGLTRDQPAATRAVAKLQASRTSSTAETQPMSWTSTCSKRVTVSTSASG